MNTNDPQAEYGKPKEREPMLSEEDVERMWYSDMFELGERRGPDGYVTKHDDELFEGGYRFGVKKCMDRYEHLITTGRLVSKEKYDELMQKYVDERLNKTSTKLSDMQDGNGQMGGGA